MPPQHPHVARATAYAKGVVNGKILACKWVRLACARHLTDLKRWTGKHAPYVFNPELAERACQFAELFPHVKGHWAIPHPGNPGATRIRLEDWQCFRRSVIFGWVDRATGLRRFQIAYTEIPRKNGKSTEGALDGLLGLSADGEFGAEVYSGATTEKQAWEVFRPAKLMAERTPAFREHYGVQVSASNIAIVANGSRFEPIIGKPGDGASPSIAIVDEYHEHLDSTLYDTMVTGMGARRQPLVDVLTTAGDNIEGPCYALRTQVIAALDGTQPNERLFGIIYTIDEGDNWTSERALRKANPNYGVSVSAEFLKASQRDAVAHSRQQNVFKTKHLNIWVTARNAWMNMEWWNRQADRKLHAAAFKDVPCYAGGDLASKLDIASVVRVFRRVEADGKPHFYIFSRHYLPADTVSDPKNRHYQGWAHDGFLTVTDGEVNDFARIREDLFQDARDHGLAELALDEWGAAETLQECGRQGIVAIAVPQTTKHFSDPMKWVEALVKSGQLHHDGNPALTWMISNIVVKEDANENIYPRKDRPELKIDGGTALIMAMGRAQLAETAISIYEERGLTVLG
jgi:phage terminase large subunit-like protein